MLLRSTARPAVLTLAAAALVAVGCGSTSKSAAPTTVVPGHSVTYFRPVQCEVPLTKSAPATPNQTCTVRLTASSPDTPARKNTGTASVVETDYAGQARYALGPADLTGAGVATAVTEKSVVNDGQYVVTLTFTPSGSAAFDAVAAKRFRCYQQVTTAPPLCSLEAITVNGIVQSAPVIEAQTFNGQAEIVGIGTRPLSESQAEALSQAIQASR